jgi:hypothetical protein
VTRIAGNRDIWKRKRVHESKGAIRARFVLISFKVLTQAASKPNEASQ